MKHGSELYELKLHELKFLVKKYEIHQKIHAKAAMMFSKSFIQFVDSVPDKSKKHKLKKLAGLAGADEKPMTKNAKNAKQQAQYRKGKNKVQQEQEQVFVKPPESSKKEIPKEYKSLYRKIASATHPDKSSDGSEVRSDIFKDLNNAIEEENYFKLVEYAMMLDIEIPDEIPLNTESIDEKIEKTKKEIKVLTKSVAWEWYHVDGEAQEALIQRYVEYLLSNT